MKYILLALILSGCATPHPARFLTQEQDDEARRMCEATGCALVPLDVLEQMLKAIGQRTI